MTRHRDLYDQYRQSEITLARDILTSFTIEQALVTAEDVGFTWKAAQDAPERFDELQAAYAHSERTKEPLPVSSENNDSIIYTASEGNVAFRFVHDVQHVRLGLTFDLVDELELALWHLGVLEAHGFSRDSLPWRMLHADLIGQAQLMALTRRFPLDQQRFVRTCLVDGIEQGLIDEARREAT